MNARGAAGRGFTRTRRRGVALLLVLWLVVLLATVTMAASGAARNSVALVDARRTASVARAMAESGVAAVTSTIDDSLRVLVNDSSARDAYLNALDAGANNGPSALGRAQSDTLGNGAFQAAAVDISARLDVNTASEASLFRLLQSFTSTGEARVLAEQIARRVRGDGAPPDEARQHQLERDSVVRALLGESAPATMLRHPFESLDELQELAGYNAAVFAKAAEFLTTDGDGTVNQRAAPAIVRAAAGGTLTAAPTRLLIVSRGWLVGRATTHEIQAVYDVSATGLRLVRWRERDL